QGRERLLDPGVVERTIEPAEGRERPLDHRPDVALLRDVGSDEDRLAASRLDARDDFLAFGLTASVDDDLRALLGELDCGGAADPGIASSDEYDSAAQPREVLHPRPGSKGGAEAPPPDRRLGWALGPATAREQLPASRRVPASRRMPAYRHRRRGTVALAAR